jgi:hypothetical protein
MHHWIALLLSVTCLSACIVVPAREVRVHDAPRYYVDERPYFHAGFHYRKQGRYWYRCPRGGREWVRLHIDFRPHAHRGRHHR